MAMYKIIGHNHKNAVYVGDEIFGPMEFEDIDHAELWLIENHPEYYFGCNIVCVDNSDFLAKAIFEYYANIHETSDFDKLIEISKKHIISRINGEYRIVSEYDEYDDYYA